MPDDSPTPIPECLHTHICPNCSYSLSGLLEAGLCPECGRAYDQSEIILYGWARGRRENLSTASRSRLAWIFLGSCASVAVEIFQIILNPRSRPWLPVVIAIWILIPLYMILRRRDNDHPGLIQIRLNDRQCVQYDSLAGPSMIAELGYCHGWLIPACVSAALLFAFDHGKADPIIFWIWFPIALILAAYLWFACRQFRLAIALVPDNAIADRNAPFRSPTPWNKIADFTLGYLTDEKQRLQINNIRQFLTGHAIDAEIRCTPEQAKHLREWLTDRLPAAGRKPKTPYRYASSAQL